MKPSLRLLGYAAAATLMALSPMPATAQLVVTDPIAIKEAVRHDVIEEAKATAQLGQMTTSTTNIIAQVKQMIADHVPLSDILQGQGSILSSQINKNNSILSQDMTLDQQSVTDYRKVAPTFDQKMSYLNYYATLRRNADSQYAAALSMTQAQLQREGGVAAAVKNVTKVRATNQLQALQQLIGLGEVQSNQMDSLIKIQAAMLKAMTTHYSTAQAQQSTNDARAEAALQYCIAYVPGFSRLSPQLRAPALAKCQQNMTEAHNTATGSL